MSSCDCGGYIRCLRCFECNMFHVSCDGCGLGTCVACGGRLI